MNITVTDVSRVTPTPPAGTKMVCVNSRGSVGFEPPFEEGKVYVVRDGFPSWETGFGFVHGLHFIGVQGEVNEEGVEVATNSRRFVELSEYKRGQVA